MLKIVQLLILRVGKIMESIDRNCIEKCGGVYKVSDNFPISRVTAKKIVSCQTNGFKRETYFYNNFFFSCKVVRIT